VWKLKVNVKETLKLFENVGVNKFITRNLIINYSYI
jgi:hypothetical protein